jgi:hypothetical protein
VILDQLQLHTVVLVKMVRILLLVFGLLKVVVDLMAQILPQVQTLVDLVVVVDLLQVRQEVIMLLVVLHHNQAQQTQVLTTT